MNAAAHRHVEQRDARRAELGGQLLGRLGPDRGVDGDHAPRGHRRRERRDHLAHLRVVAHHHRRPRRRRRRRPRPTPPPPRPLGQRRGRRRPRRRTPPGPPGHVEQPPGHRRADLAEPDEADRPSVTSSSAVGPERRRRAAERVVAGQVAAEGAVHAGRHAVGQRAVADHLQEAGGGVAVVEPVALEAPLEVAAVAEPLAADAGHLVARAVGPRRRAATCFQKPTTWPFRSSMRISWYGYSQPSRPPISRPTRDVADLARGRRS